MRREKASREIVVMALKFVLLFYGLSKVAFLRLWTQYEIDHAPTSAEKAGMESHNETHRSVLDTNHHLRRELETMFRNPNGSGLTHVRKMTSLAHEHKSMEPDQVKQHRGKPVFSA